MGVQRIVPHTLDYCMTVLKLTLKCIIFGGCVYPKAVQTSAFHLKGEHMLYMNVKQESKGWLEQTQLAVGTHCLGKEIGIFAVGRVRQE